MRKLAFAAFAAFVVLAPAQAAEEGPSIPQQKWSFEGILGTYDRAALQRGFQVYKEVCASCHSMDLVRYRDLGPPGIGGNGGLGFSADEVKALAAEVEVTDGPNDAGEMFQRPGRPADKFKAPFANANAARAANNGALPPDLSLIAKARVGGPDYVYALLTGYSDPPAGVTMMEGMAYNKFFPGHQIAMPPPLNADQVNYADGTKATVEQMAHDITSFLAWAAEPELEARKRLGVKVILFLIILSGLLYITKRKIWADVH
ncbi:MAG TPA: cytochrome c1 [Alphaproteobacteria bacterium]|nr:cytochrome c1 [Alphaproteobacteria bacterium]